MSEKFNLKEWMHQNGQGPYKLHENYIDLKAIGSLKEEKPEELEDIPTEEEPKTSGRPPHATSIKPWWDTEAKDDMIQENFGIDFKVTGYIGKKPVFTAMEDGLELEVSPNPEGTYSVWVGDMQMDQKFKDSTEAMKYLNSVGDIKSLIKGGLKEEGEAINEEEGTFEYQENCTGSFLTFKSTYKGNEIDSVGDIEFTLKFGLYIEARSYGIKTMSIVNLQGPSELEVEVEYYPQGSEETATETVTLPIDWSTVNMDKDSDLSYIGLAKNVDFELANDSKGNLFIKTAYVYYNAL
jgi:hypothetical protein